uniref:Uncharacterized protein n=1 Tax=Rhizophora mucronata TaxID=61149 RepID=A0A2P2JQ19_RHIMU
MQEHRRLKQSCSHLKLHFQCLNNGKLYKKNFKMSLSIYTTNCLCFSFFQE